MASAPTLGNRFVELQTAQYSASTYLTVATLDLRNGRADMNAVESNARKVVFGVLCPAALVLVSVIETLARTLFSVGVTVYCVANGGDKAEGAQKERHEYLSNLAYSGSFYTGENVATCVMAIIENIRNWNEPAFRLNYDALLPAFVNYNKESLAAIDFQLSFEEAAAPAPAAPAGGAAAAPAAGEAPKAEEPKKPEVAPSAPAAPKAEAPKSEDSAA